MDRYHYTYLRLARRYKDTIKLLKDLPTTNRPVERIGQEIIELEEYYRKTRRDYRFRHHRRKSLIATGLMGGFFSFIILWSNPPAFVAIPSVIALGIFLKGIYGGLNVRVERLTSAQRQDIHDFIILISMGLMRYQSCDNPKVYTSTIYDIEQLIQYIENRVIKGIP